MTRGSANASLIPIMALALVLAACSILYELLAAQALSKLVGNTVVWYSLVVGLYLASMGIGAFFSEKISSGSTWRSLVRIEIVLTIIGAATVPLIHMGHTIYAQNIIHNEIAFGLTVFYSTAISLVTLLGILTGAELPLLMRLAREIRDETRSANMALGWDYFGSLAGAMIFPLIIVPNINLVNAGLLIATVNLLVAVWIVAMRLNIRIAIPEAALSLSLLVSVGYTATKADSINTFLQEKYFFFHLVNTESIGEWFDHGDRFPGIVEKRSPYQTMHLITNPRPSTQAGFMATYSQKLERYPDYPLDYQLFLDGAHQTDTRYEEVYHEWFAHMPISMWNTGKVPDSVLVLGGGDGFLIRELLKYGGIKSIRQIDIDNALIEFAKTNPVLRSVNRDALADPRVNTTITDGYQYLRQTTDSYDAIFIDLPVANNYDLAKLYSREFYEFVKKTNQAWRLRRV